MSGRMDVEHARAQLADLHRQMNYLRFMRIQIPSSMAWQLLQTAEQLCDHLKTLETP